MTKKAEKALKKIEKACKNLKKYIIEREQFCGINEELRVLGEDMDLIHGKFLIHIRKNNENDKSTSSSSS